MGIGDVNNLRVRRPGDPTRPVRSQDTYLQMFDADVDVSAAEVYRCVAMKLGGMQSSYGNMILESTLQSTSRVYVVCGLVPNSKVLSR